jgi:4-amino-4-deoxy-L-arabinose transferase-like glycosyltransferase
MTSTGNLQETQRLLPRLLDSPRFVRWLLLMGLALRLAWVFAWDNEQFIKDYQWMDERARELAQGQGYSHHGGGPTAYYPIGYPFFLSVLYRIFGPHEMAGKLANVLFSVGLLAGIYALGRRLFSERTARLALAVMVFHPNQIAYCSLLATETGFTMLLVWAVVVALAAPGRWTGPLLGVVLGLATYLRPTGPGLFPIFFCCLWATRRDWKQAVVHTMLAALVALIVLAPWLIRNQRVFGHFLLSNNGGVVMLVGANPAATGQYFRPPIITEMHERISEGGAAEYEWSREAQRLALQYIREHPIHWLFHLGPRKLYYTYRHDVDGIWHTLNGLEQPVSGLTWKLLTAIGKLYYYVIWLLALGYAGFCLKQRKVLTLPNLCWLFVFLFSAVAVVFHGLPRYHYSIMPFLILYAGEALQVVLARGRNGSTPG